MLKLVNTEAPLCSLTYRNIAIALVFSLFPRHSSHICLSNLRIGNKKQNPQAKCLSSAGFPQTTFDIVFRQTERIERGTLLSLFFYLFVYVRAFKAFRFLNLQVQIYALFLNFQNFLKKFYSFTSKFTPQRRKQCWSV